MGQFYIGSDTHDNRSPQEVAQVLIRAGRQPVWKDWDPYLGRAAIAV